MRQLLYALPVDPDAPLPVPVAVRHRLERVLRLARGAPLLLGDGHGQQQAVAFDGDHFLPQGPRVRHAAPRIALQLACAVLKGEHFDWMVEKVAEVGAATLQPLQTAHCVAKATGPGAAQRQIRWQAVSDAAFEQCGSPWRTVVLPPVLLGGWLQNHATQGPLAVCDERGAPHPLAYVVKRAAEKADPAPLTVLIGPEGGLSEVEREILQTYDSVRVSLGRAVLRAETAAVAAAVIVATALDG